MTTPSPENLPSEPPEFTDKNQTVDSFKTTESGESSSFLLLAETHWEQFEVSGKAEDINKAVEYQNEGIMRTPQGDPEMHQRLGELGILLRARFRLLGNLEDLDGAIGCGVNALALTPLGHQDKPMWLNNLGSCFESKFERLGELGDLDKAIEYKTQAVSLTPQEHPSLPTRLNNLGYSLHSRFDRLGELPDLESAIDAQSRAVSLTPLGSIDMPLWVSNLGSTLRSRFERLGRLVDLEKSIEYRTQAVSLTPQSDPSMPILLNNLGSSVLDRFERLGGLVDLNDAINHLSQAVFLTPEGHPDKPIRLNNLGTSLQGRFKRLGELVDLDNAIECFDHAISLTPQGHADMPRLLHNLGSSLQSRHDRLDELADLDRAIECTSQAVFLTPSGHSDMPMRLITLGNSLDSRFGQLKNLADLDKAIEYKSQAVSLTPQGHSYLPMWLDNLGYSHHKRFEHIGQVADIETVIEYRTQAVSLTPEDHRDMPMRLNNLAQSLKSRFEFGGGPTDLDVAIEHMVRAVSLTPQGHADLPGWLSNLGHAFNDRSKLHDTTNDVDQSLEYFQKSAESFSGSPSIRLYSALQWARMCADHRPSLLLQSYQQVMILLPQVVWLGSALDSRYRRVANIGDISTEAAAAAIRIKQYGLALEWLEEGRSIIWKQMLQLRTPVDDLIVVNPGLAEELRSVARDLDYSSSPKAASEAAVPSVHSLEQSAQQHRRLAERWEKLVNKVRQLPGLQGFLRPRNASELMCSARSSPVVVINVHKTRCDALVIQPGSVDISHIPLRFSHDKAVNARVQMHHLIGSRGLISRGFQVFRPKPENMFGTTLSQLWNEVVKPILDFLGYTQIPLTGNLPHITWCTTGPLSFLPLHAAGDYVAESMIFNYVVSSYTPTLSALLLPPSTVKSFSGILAVGQEFTPNMPPLPGTANELARIQEKSQGLTFTRLDKQLATPAAVLAGMEKHSWIHLACHAMQNATNPAQSAFYLHGGMLGLPAITQKQLKHVDLAFLSACQTATGDETLSEEAVHLAAGMLMAGYRTVIATMWSIGDEDAPLIAEKVYEHLLEGGTPDARRTAVALHKATECLRAKAGVKEFAKWVPYIHIGQ